MSFLWLTRFPPYPPLRGGALDYSRMLLASLAMQGPVTGLAFVPEQPVEQPADGVTWETLPRSMPGKIKSLLSPLPNVAARNVDTAYLRRAVELARSAEAVFVDFIAMSWLVEPLKAAMRDWAERPPLIVVTHNHEHAVRLQMVRNTRSPAMRAALTLDAWKAGRLERRANLAANGITAITVADRDAFARDAATPSITLPPAYGGPAAATRTIGADTPRAAIILGNRDSHHKVMVLERTLAALDAAGLPRALHLQVAGGGDLDGFAARYPDIAFLGFVDDIVACLGKVRLGLLTDDIGGGFKIRAMTYAALRVPMLALREAMHGMEFEEGVHYIAVDTLDELAARAAVLIDDLDTLNAVQEAAFAFAEARFAPSEPGRRLADFVARLSA
ncbi:glycosyltransferase family protein [Sphingomonas immobilis]|uniref:Glycosyltransferase n=1 Tax=Sphingomonas immobilis TaxID=3063997 RepID=A0ABT9A5I6_9SPHN|nr:hypothetical protein [Sphingomonas sp. CA1-15]MDO7844609.1 hypothetical protein [Sphingomonas sp. CA1-15]